MTTRTPTMVAMTAITLSQLSSGRFILGLGPSAPQVVEGGHGGPYGKPLTRLKEYVRIIKDCRKYKAFSIKNSGYDAYFGMSADSLSEDAEFDVDESATKAQIKKAFVKSLKVKKLNKKVLGEFVSLVV